MDAVTLALAKKYTADTVAGMGAIKGDKGDKGNDGISPTIAVNTSSDTVYTLDISDKTHSFTTPNLKGAKGETGAQGIRGEKGEQGAQGIQGETGAKGDKGDRGDDGYPFLIYKQYDSISEFDADDFPEIGLMFMVNSWEEDKGFPIYRYTGNESYSLITYMNTEGIKGEKGDKGDKGDTGDKGSDGLNGIDGATYTPVVKSVSTLDADASAIVSVELNDETKTAGFSFGIPRGKDGKDGEDGVDGKDAEIVDEVKSGETKAVSSGAVYDKFASLSSWSDWKDLPVTQKVDDIKIESPIVRYKENRLLGMIYLETRFRVISTTKTYNNAVAVVDMTTATWELFRDVDYVTLDAYARQDSGPVIVQLGYDKTIWVKATDQIGLTYDINGFSLIPVQWK